MVIPGGKEYSGIAGSVVVNMVLGNWLHKRTV